MELPGAEGAVEQPRLHLDGAEVVLVGRPEHRVATIIQIQPLKIIWKKSSQASIKLLLVKNISKHFSLKVLSSVLSLVFKVFKEGVREGKYFIENIHF